MMKYNKWDGLKIQFSRYIKNISQVRNKRSGQTCTMPMRRKGTREVRTAIYTFESHY